MRARLTLVALVLSGALSLAHTATAAPPSNDAFSSATVVVSMPFAETVDITEATRTYDEPTFGCYGAPQRTVWYRFSVGADATVGVAGTSTVIGDVSIGVFRDGGSGVSGLRFVNCGSGPAPRVTFAATAGEVYYVQLGNSFSAGGPIDVSIEIVPPPPNDDAGDAANVALPLAEAVDMTAATVETGEPVPSCFYAGGNSIWYAVTTATDTSVTVTVGAPDLTTTAVYTGSPLAAPTEVACRTYSGPLTFRTQAGTTTYVRVAAFGPRIVDVRIERARDPIADFWWYPDPLSMFDTGSFSNASVDPGGTPWRLVQWDFGDGATAVDCCAPHRFAADGDYRVVLTVETLDGRTASVAKVVPVRTHDVVIRKFTLPRSTRLGQTISVDVDLTNARYDEVVQVQLFRTRPSVYGDPYELVGTLEKPVPVRPRAATTFSYRYTVRDEDASAGKVSFMALAWIVGQSDALAADNRLTSQVVKVSG